MAEPPEHTDRLVGASARPRGAGWTVLGPKRLKREFISQLTGLGPCRCSVSAPSPAENGASAWIVNRTRRGPFLTLFEVCGY